jgi:hypothetical protein
MGFEAVVGTQKPEINFLSFEAVEYMLRTLKSRMSDFRLFGMSLAKKDG